MGKQHPAKSKAGNDDYTYEARLVVQHKLEQDLHFGETNFDILAMLRGRGLLAKEINFKAGTASIGPTSFNVAISERNMAVIKDRLLKRFIPSIQSLQLKLRDKFKFIAIDTCPICQFMLDTVTSPFGLKDNPYDLLLGDGAVYCTVCGVPFIVDSEFMLLGISTKSESGPLHIEEIASIQCEGYITMVPVDFLTRARHIYEAFRTPSGELGAIGTEHMNQAIESYEKKRLKDVSDALVPEECALMLVPSPGEAVTVPAETGEDKKE